MGRKRMTRAQLRRCEGPAEALAVEATHHLHAALGRRAAPDTLALIAIALANVRVHGAPAARLMGERLPPLRFQAILRAADPAELIRPLRRALVQIDGTADVARLARDLLYWGEDVCNRWCFEFFGASVPSPADSQSKETPS